jgi:hypothetical protein
MLPVQGAVNELQNIGENASMLDERYSLTSVEDNTLVKYTFIYHFLGFLWTSEFVSAIGMITIAGAVASDYWVTDTRYVPQWPVLASFGRTMRYHTGSAAYGSLIVALVRLVRYVMMCPPPPLSGRVFSFSASAPAPAPPPAQRWSVTGTLT